MDSLTFSSFTKRAIAVTAAVVCMTQGSAVLPSAHAQISLPDLPSATVPTFKPACDDALRQFAGHSVNLPSAAQAAFNSACGGGNGGGMSSSSKSSSSSSMSSSGGSSSSVSSSVSSSNGSSSSSTSSTSSVSSMSSSAMSSVSSSMSSSSSSANMGNLIQNPSLETDGGNGSPLHWNKGGYGNNDAVFNYPVIGIDGKAAEVSISKYSDGDAKWYFEDVAVIPGEQYTFADAFKSTAPSIVTVRYTMTDNSFVYAQLAALATSSTWQQFSTTITPPAGAVSLTVFHVLQSAGALSVDTYNLQRKAPAPSDAFDQGYVSLNFDDGWTSAYRTVKPMLDKANMKGTFYIITNEANNASDQDLNDPNSYLTYAKLLEIQNAGHEVTAHTRTHTSLISLSQQQATNEVQGSRSDLLNHGFTPVASFAYPYGDYNTSVINIVKNAGFAGARSVEEGYNTRTDNKYALKVQNVLMGTTAQQMKQWIDHAVQTKTWLTIVFHQVDHLTHTEEDYSTTPETLQEVVNYLKLNEIPVITMNQGIQKMQ